MERHRRTAAGGRLRVHRLHHRYRSRHPRRRGVRRRCRGVHRRGRGLGAPDLLRRRDPDRPGLAQPGGGDLPQPGAQPPADVDGRRRAGRADRRDVHPHGLGGTLRRRGRGRRRLLAARLRDLDRGGRGDAGGRRAVQRGEAAAGGRGRRRASRRLPAGAAIAAGRSGSRNLGGCFASLRARSQRRARRRAQAGRRTGQHEEFGPLFLHQQVSYFAAHERTHPPQIEALRERFA